MGLDVVYGHDEGRQNHQERESFELIPFRDLERLIGLIPDDTFDTVDKRMICEEAHGHGINAMTEKDQRTYTKMKELILNILAEFNII